MARKVPARGPEEAIGAALGLIMLAVVGAGVVGRYLGHPVQATEEVALACFVWMVFVGAAAACRDDLHAGMDALVVALPARWQWRLRIVSDLLVLAVAAGFAWVGWRYAQVGWTTRGIATDVPLFWVYVSLPAGSLLVIWRTLERLVAHLRHRGAPVPLPAGDGQAL